MFAVWFPCSFPLVLHREYLEITSPVPSPLSLSIDLGGSICIVLTPGDSKFRPCLSTRAAGFIGERCFQSLIFLPLERHRCLLYMGLEGAEECSPLSLCCSRVFGPLCEGRAHVDRKEKPHSLVSMQELIIPESLLFKRLAFHGPFACGYGGNR